MDIQITQVLVWILWVVFDDGLRDKDKVRLDIKRSRILNKGLNG
jgi:hypothetical protein